MLINAINRSGLVEVPLKPTKNNLNLDAKCLVKKEKKIFFKCWFVLHTAQSYVMLT